MKQNYLNVRFIKSLIADIDMAMSIEDAALSDQEITKWGTSDDFIFSEYLSKHFDESLPCERKAAMQIVRTIINASAEAYWELLEDNYLCYEDYNLPDERIDDIINELDIEQRNY